MSLADVADRSGLTPSFLSQMERDLANPSLATLRQVCRALSLPVFQLFLDEEPRSLLVHREERRILPGEAGTLFELLSPVGHQHKIELIFMRLEPGAANHPEPWTHQGEEAALCIGGKVLITVGDAKYELGPGDTLYLDSSVPHRYVNIGDDAAEVLMAITPPGY